MPRLRASSRLAILLTFLSSSLLSANDGLITTIAGTGQGGSTATGIPATTAQITTPGGICADASNNLFIADGSNNRVVRVDAVTGILTLVAGNGTASSTGDGGPAPLASIYSPMSVALDGAGNLYIAEFGGNRIRRVDHQTGVITTMAGTGMAGFGGDGGLATSAAINRVAGIAFDSTGDLYFADFGNNRVRRIDAQTGIVTTVAGNGSAALTADGVLATSAGMAGPIWVAFDPSGGLLISEWGANRIRRVDPSTGILTTVAGNGNANFTGDGVPATSAGIGATIGLAVASNGNLFFADGTGRIRKVDAATGWITTVAGNGTGPHDVGSASAGGGGGGGSSQPPCFSTVAGDNGPATSATLDGPIALLLTSDGNLMISDSLDCRIRRVDLPSPFSYTNTTLTASATTLQPGQAELLTATVTPIGLSGVPTGAVQFVDATMGNVAVLATIALNGGAASYLNTAGNLGGHLVMAIYSGDTSFNGSGSPQISLSQSSATKYTSTVALSANPTPSPMGTATVFTVTVTPPPGAATAPSGPVVLVDGQTVVATANLVNGVATLSDVFTTPGNHAMTAVYLGDNNYSQVFTSLTQPVNGSTQVVITSSAPNSTYGQPIQITISVVPPSATGSIQLIVDQVPIPGSGSLTNGSVVAQPNPLLNAGSHTITALYSGDANNPPATSPTFIQNVAKATPVFTVTSSLNPSVAGQAVTLTVTMTPVSTGAALGLDIGNPPASLQATWSAGKTYITTADLSPGPHSVTGTWAGDANVLPGSSAILTQSVQTIATTTSLTASPNPSIYGGAVTLTATVLRAGATGQVVFSNNGVAVATANLVSGQAQVSIATLPVGSNSLTAEYSGDTTHAGSTSAALPQIVTPAAYPTSVTLTSSANPSIAGLQLWLTATVSPATATGTVQFLDGATLLGTATLAGGWATLSLSTLPVGTHSITALYSGDVNYLAGTSAALAETIAPATPPVVAPNVITTLAGLPNGCPPGVTYCGISRPVADSAGNVYFQDGFQILARNTSGTVSAIAGTGQQGNSGDGGPALSANLGYVGQIAVHGSRLCFGDPAAYKVRCVDLSTGLIQGYGTGNPRSAGDGGNVSNASFYWPVGAAFDDAGNLYISDSAAYSVRRIDAVTGTITAFAGPGPGYSGAPLGDGGPAVSANLINPVNLSYYNGGIYIADQGDGWIRRVDVATGMISSVAAALSPYYLAMDQSGNLFFTTGQTIKMMDTSGNVSAIANTNDYSGVGSDDILATDTTFEGITGLGWDPVARRLLIADQSRLRQIFFTPPTTTALTLSANPAVPGGQVTLEATVSPATATGNVRFYQGGLLLGSAPLVSSVADFTWTAPIGGNSTYAMRAVYGGDAGDNLSMSATLTETLAQGTTQTTTSLTVSPNPSVLGGSVLLSATVSPAAATGSVAFYRNGSIVGTATVAGGQAQLSIATLPLGSSLLSARYGGDLTYAGSFANIVTQIVVAAPTGIALTSSANPSNAGQALTLTAAISPATATGTVQFLDGATALGTATISGGSATLSVSTLSAGAHSITAVYSGDANNPGGTSAVLAQTINKMASSVALASSANPSTSGQGITFTAAVTPNTATGTVQFMDGATVLGTVPVTGGSAILALSTLSADTHSITAIYSGDANNAGSTSSVLVQTVDKLASSIVLTYSANPAPLGQPLTLTGTLSPSSATGTVQFLDYTVPLGTATITGGSAAFSTSSLTAGQHTIVLVYGGDATYAGATTAFVIYVKPVTTMALSVLPSPPIAGQAVTFTAVLSPGAATGTVNFADWSGVQLGTVPVNGGKATVVVSPQTLAYAPGAQKIMATYSGDATYMYITAYLTFTVNQASTSVALASSKNPSTSGQSVTFTAAVSPASAGGTVKFLDGVTALGTVPVSGGSALLSLSTLSAGAHSITAVYSGDANDTGSTSAALAQTVNMVTSGVTLVSSQNPALFGQSIPLSATVTPGSATGTVQFMDGSTVLGTMTVSGGSALLSLSTLSAGTHSITAVYSGDANDSPSTSAAIAETVQQAPTTTTLTSSTDRSPLGQNVSLTATVTPASASGTVNLMQGTTILATSTLTNGVATFSISSLPVGSNSLYARYAGNASYLPSSSATVTQVVLILTSTTLTTTPNPSAYGAPVTLTLTASPTSATGPVQFNNGATVLGPANLVNGQAKLTVANLAVGNASLIAYYSGDATHAGFTSLIVTQTVNKAPASVAFSSSKNPSVVGQSVTFTAAVSPNSATGTVQFLDGATVVGTAAISGGAASLSLTTLTVGAHSIKASYSGDSNYLTATSPALTQTISPPAQACHVTYVVTTQWNVGFGTAVTIQNTGSAPVNGWDLTWTWAGNQKITQSWNSTYSQTGANAKLTNESYNPAIAAGASLNGIGFNGSYSGTNTNPAAFYLNGTLCN